MDRLEIEEKRVESAEERLLADEEAMKKARYDQWRRKSQRRVAAMDPVFPPKKLDADDAKVVSHPVDFIVFRGMNSASSIKNIILLDARSKRGPVQKSIEKAVEKEQYDWATFRINDDGSIKKE